MVLAPDRCPLLKTCQLEDGKIYNNICVALFDIYYFTPVPFAMVG